MIAVFVDIFENKNVVTGGERQLQEMIKGLKRHGYMIECIDSSQALKKIKQLCKEYDRKEIVIINDYSRRFSLFFINIICKMFLRVAVCTNVGNFYFDYRTSKIKNIIDYGVSYLYLRPSNIIFTTGVAVDNRLRKIGLKNNRMRAVYPALRESLIHYSKENEVEKSNQKKMVLLVARFHPVKGLDYWVDAISLCREEDLHFVMVGDYQRNPDYYNHIVKRIRNEGLEKNVTIYGKTNTDEELARLYTEAWCCIHTSVYDPSPMTICEPLLFGKTVVAADVGGIREYLTDGFDSLIVPAKNGAATAEAIKRLLYNKELYDQLSSNTNITLKRFINRRWADAGEEYYVAISSEIE